MRISTRHSPSLRLLLSIAAVVLLALPATALARGVSAPTRVTAPTRSFHPAKAAKPKKAKKRPAPQHVVIKPLAHGPAKKAPKKPAKPTGSAPQRGHKPAAQH